jgi:hypothetical protein
VSLEPVFSGFGDNTLAFRPTGVSYANPGADTTYSINVSGMTGTNVPPSIQYTVTIIDPDAMVNPMSQTIGPITTSPVTLTYSPGGTFTLSATATSGLTVTFASLTPGVCSVNGGTGTMLAAGTCTIAANQEGDTSFMAAPQRTQDFTISGGLPGAPTAVTATAGNGQASVTFTPPADSGGSPVTGYTVTSSPGGGVDRNAGTTAIAHVVTGLTNGTPYTFTVRATNAAGLGAPSAASNTVTPSATQNTTAGSAANYFFHEGGRFVSLDATTTHRWYRFRAVAGRSYCVEVVADEFDQTTADSIVTVLRADGISVITSNDDNNQEPGGLGVGGPSRACYIAGFTEDNLADVRRFTLGSVGNHKLRITDTTIYSPWWYVSRADGYNAFITMSNTTNATVVSIVTARDNAGIAVGSQTVTLPANGNTVIPLTTFVSSGFGSASIAHGGAPGAIAADITTMSPVTGLSFGAVFSPRLEFGR